MVTPSRSWSSWVSCIVVGWTRAGPSRGGNGGGGQAREWVAPRNRLSPWKERMAALESRAGDSRPIFLQSQLPLFRRAGLRSHGGCASDFAELASHERIWERPHSQPLHTKGAGHGGKGRNSDSLRHTKCVPLCVCLRPPGPFLVKESGHSCYLFICGSLMDGAQ